MLFYKREPNVTEPSGVAKLFSFREYFDRTKYGVGEVVQSLSIVRTEATYKQNDCKKVPDRK